MSRALPVSGAGTVLEQTSPESSAISERGARATSPYERFCNRCWLHLPAVFLRRGGKMSNLLGSIARSLRALAVCLATAVWVLLLLSASGHADPGLWVAKGPNAT